MALYKARPKTPYYFWAVMSIVLQATTSGEDILLLLHSLLLDKFALYDSVHLVKSK
jgi:hypothetical protein